MKNLILIFSILITMTVLPIFAETTEKYPLIAKHYYYFTSVKSLDGITVYTIKYYEGTSILITLEANKDGNITLELPSDLLKLRYKCSTQGSVDNPFVLIDGSEIRTTTVQLNEKLYSLEIPITKGVEQIEVITTTDMGMWAYPDGCPIEFFENAIPLQPKKQISIGILAEDVVCKEGLELLIKPDTYLPACVKSETKSKLLERGWFDRGRIFE